MVLANRGLGSKGAASASNLFVRLGAAQLLRGRLGEMGSRWQDYLYGIP